jgi:Zinc knuckle
MPGRSEMETSNRPDRRNAVVCDSLPGIPIQEYLVAIADIVSAAKITHASRIGGNRVIVYLKDIESAQAVVEDGGISINGEFISVRKYITGAQKVLVSNVLPDITNDQLVTVLQKYGRVTGNVREVQIGCELPEFAHIKSFRRVVYMIIPEIKSFPPFVNINIEANSPWTCFLSIDDASCFKCKKSGHLARDCVPASEAPKGPTPTIDITTTTSTPSTSTSTTTADKPTSQTKLSLADIVSGRISASTTLKMQPHNQRQVFPILTSSTPPETENIADMRTESAEADLASNEEERDPPPKRTRLNSQKTDDDDDGSYDSTTSTSSREDQLARDESSISTMVAMLDDIYVISPPQLEEFLKKTRGLKRPAVAAVNFTTDAKGLIAMLSAAKIHASTYNLKRRLQRTIKSVEKESVNWPKKGNNPGEPKQ